MKSRYCAIDESGDLGISKKSSKYFIIACFLFDDINFQRKIRKLILKLHKKKDVEILHASHDDDNVKIKVVKFLSKESWRGKVFVFKKDKNVDYISYLEFCLENIDIQDRLFVSTPNRNKSFSDKVKKLNGKIILTTMRNELSLQMADFLAWVVYRNYEMGDNLYLKLIKDKLEIVEYKKITKQNPLIHD